MRVLQAEMHRNDESSLAALLGAKGDTLEAARIVNGRCGVAPTRAAITRFDGVLYGELGYASLPPGSRRRLDRSVLILNALHGVSAARDLLPEFRLGFDARLGELGRLAAWWRPMITAELATRLAGAVVWDLLPGEHGAAWDPTEVPMRRHVRVRFVDAHGRTVSHWNKLLKGALVSHLAKVGFDDPGSLESFTHSSGYRWDPDATVIDGRCTTHVVSART